MATGYRGDLAAEVPRCGCKECVHPGQRVYINGFLRVLPLPHPSKQELPAAAAQCRPLLWHVEARARTHNTKMAEPCHQLGTPNFTSLTTMPLSATALTHRNGNKGSGVLTISGRTDPATRTPEGVFLFLEWPTYNSFYLLSPGSLSDNAPLLGTRSQAHRAVSGAWSLRLTHRLAHNLLPLYPTQPRASTLSFRFL